MSSEGMTGILRAPLLPQRTTRMRNWLLPEYIEDILPPEARADRGAAPQLLDLFRVHGYELVQPPLLEYLESLLTGTGRDLDLRTFKLVDQLSGRTLGVRADITPQVARIDAHLLNREGVTRLCYCGQRAAHAARRARCHARAAADRRRALRPCRHRGDREILRLLLRRAAALPACAGVRLDLGHVGVFRALAQRGAIGAGAEAELFAALQAKDVPALRELVARRWPRRRARRCWRCRSCTAAARCWRARARASAGATRRSRARSTTCATGAARATPDVPVWLRSGRPARLSLPQRRRLRRLLRRHAQRDRARRPLRRASARRSAAPGRRPASPWTCASWRAWRRPSRRRGACARRWPSDPALRGRDRKPARGGRGRDVGSAGARGRRRRAALRARTGQAKGKWQVRTAAMRIACEPVDESASRLQRSEPKDRAWQRT